MRAELLLWVVLRLLRRGVLGVARVGLSRRGYWVASLSWIHRIVHVLAIREWTVAHRQLVIPARRPGQRKHR